MSDNRNSRTRHQEKVSQNVDDITGFLSTRGGGFFVITLLGVVVVCTIIGNWVL